MRKIINKKIINKKNVYICIAIVLIILIAQGIRVAMNSNTANSEELPLVITEEVDSGEGFQEYTYSGSVVGRTEHQLSFLVGGKVTNKQVEVGDAVSEGDLLLQVDAQDIQQNASLVDAQLSAAKSQFDLASDNYQRYKTLYEEGAVAEAAYDSAKTSYDVAREAYNQAKAQYNVTANQLSYTNLYADTTGVVTNVAAEVGQVVGAGQAVVTVVSDGEKEVEIDVPENRLEQLKSAKTINVEFWALPDLVLSGTLREVSPIADEVTRTYKARVSLSNPPDGLELGMTASVTLLNNTSSDRTIFIPLSAIYQTGDTPTVWVVDEKSVLKLTKVTVGEFKDDKIQVITGLKDGDIIVKAGVHKLSEGLKVKTASEVQ